MSKNFLIVAYKKLQQRLRYGLSHAEEDALHDAFYKLWTGGYIPATKEEGEKLLYTTLRRRQISLWRQAGDAGGGRQDATKQGKEEDKGYI